MSRAPLPPARSPEDAGRPGAAAGRRRTAYGGLGNAIAVTMAGLGFFFAIIGVFGLAPAILGLVAFVLLASAIWAAEEPER